MWLGALVLVGCITGGLVYTASRQKGGLHTKSRITNILILNYYARKKLV
jgi:hypothetical protein